VSVISHSSSNDKVDADLSEGTSKVVINTIRPGGRNFISTIVAPSIESPLLLVSGKTGLIKQRVSCNGVIFDALVDTGAFTCTVDASVAAKHGWKLCASKLRLFHAIGEEMKCLGNTEVDLALTLGKTTRSTRQVLTVVENLCAELILGVDLIRRLSVIINASHRTPLTFGKQTGKSMKGIRAKQTTLPPRSCNLISAKIQTTAKLVMVMPFGFDNAIHASYSLCRVRNDEVLVQVVNTDCQAIELAENIQIASFAIVSQTVPSSTSNLNLVVPIDESGEKPETVVVGDNLNPEQVSQLREVLVDNIDAFSLRGQIGLSQIFEHSIELIPDAKPFAEPVRRHPRVHVDEADRQVRDMLQQGIIEESSSPWASEYVMVRKKTGEWRMCVDYRRLNSVTKKNSYPLPNIEECLEALAGKAYFSKLDFASGYWQMPVAEGSRELTAFRTGGGLYQFKVMPFGLTNAPASFQRMINLMFAGLKGLKLQVFLDDVCLATETWSEHLELLDNVLKIVIKHNLKLKGSKCAFGLSEITFLGHKVSTVGIMQDPDKLRAFTDLPRPQNVSEVRRVLGAFGYYRRFVYNYSAIAAPIIQLTKNETQFVWGPEQDYAFKKLKEELMKNATLSHFNTNDPTMLKTDACREGIAGMLLQQRDGDWKLVSCVSRRLNDAERNYGITELEGLAIVYSVQKFRCYLLGREFVIVTDHCALCSLGKKISQNSRLRRWSIVLSEYNFTIVYRKGSLHCDVDCLSRAPVCDEGDEFLDKILNINGRPDLLPQPLRPEEWISEYEDDESQEVLNRVNADANLSIVEGLIYYGNKLYVPPALRTQMLRENHDQGAAGHDGVDNTIYRMRFLWWPELKREVEEYVRRCERCQLRKPKRTLPHGTMQPHEAFAPLNQLAFDHIGPWHATISNKRFVCVGVDTFSRFVFAKAVIDQTAASFAEYLNELIGLFGIPQSILTDNSRAFDNALVRAIEDEHGIHHEWSAPGHSQGNAVAERAIESLEEKLSLVIQENDLDWEQAIPLATLSINTRRNVTTGFAPFELMFNRTNQVTSRSLSKYNNTPLEPSIVEANRADAIASTSDAHLRSKTRFDNRHQPTVFEPGTLVMSKRSSRRSKLSNRYDGPCEVLERNKDIYKIKNQATGRILTRHASHLERYNQAADPDQANPPDRPANGMINRITLITTVLLILVSMVSAKIMLPQEAPTHWVEDETVFVSEGDEYLVYEIHYGSPCSALTQHPGYQHQSPNSGGKPPGPPTQLIYQQPGIGLQSSSPVFNPRPIPSQQQPSALGNQLPMAPHSNGFIAKPPIIAQNLPPTQQTNPPEEEEGDGSGNENVENSPQGVVKRNSIGSFYQAQCERTFQEIIVGSLTRFRSQTHVNDHEKRQIEFVAGYVVSNILTTVKDLFVSRTTSRLEERLSNAENRLAALNARQDLLALSLRALAKFNRAEQKAFNAITGQVSQLADITVLYEFIVSEMQRVSNKHDRLYGSIRTGSPDLVTIAEIFDTSTFGRLQVRDIENVAVESPHPGVLRIRVEGPIRSNDTKVYDVVAFPYYTNFTGKSGYKKEYIGSTRVMRNSSANCVRGIGASASKKSIKLLCKDTDFKDPLIRKWKSTYIENLKQENLRPMSSVVWPTMRVQCYTRELIFTENKQTWNTTCPAYVTSINLRHTFRTSDGIINHFGGETQKQHYTPKILTDVLDFHFDEFEPVHQELEHSMQHAESLIERQEILKNSTVVFTVNNTPVTYHLIIYGAIALSFLINGWLLFRYIRHVQQNKPEVSQSTTSAETKTNEEVANLKNQLDKQDVKLDALIQAATELETVSVTSRPRSRSGRRQVRRLSIEPARDTLQYTIVPTFLEDSV
jgi:transposase InsO family protein/transposase-like protein